MKMQCQFQCDNGLYFLLFLFVQGLHRFHQLEVTEKKRTDASLLMYIKQPEDYLWFSIVFNPICILPFLRTICLIWINARFTHALLITQTEKDICASRY